MLVCSRHSSAGQTGIRVITFPGCFCPVIEWLLNWPFGDWSDFWVGGDLPVKGRAGVRVLTVTVDSE